MFSCLFNVYGCSNKGGENGDRKENNEISGGGKRVKIAWPLVCRKVGSLW